MAGKVVEIQSILGRDRLAVELSNKYDDWNQMRATWLVEKDEIRNYIFATDTTKTTNKTLPWKNTTSLPKLCQIRDNLLANYITALFPNDDWLRWEAYTQESDEVNKKNAIQAYMSNKLRESDFYSLVSSLLEDYVTYGNCFAEVQFVKETKIEPDTGEEIAGYVGPRVVRRSPYDVVFNPTARTFGDSPKFTRYIKTIGELKSDMLEHPNNEYINEIISKAEGVRSEIAAFNDGDIHKAAGFMIDGFGSLADYYQSNYVEILKFEGDIHEDFSGKLLKDQEIIIIDRSYIIYQEINKNWSNKSSMVHGGWRKRPDNLYAMGPLDNLIGMQYRIDHLENLKADVFDIIAHPVLKIRGNVEEFEWAPGVEIFLGDDGDVEMLVPDTTALNADNQIQILENRMEEMAGAPKQAMGIRTPGEKTAFEVQSLENAAGRIFQHKITNFEIEVIEPLLNLFLEIGRRNLDGADLVRVMDDDLGVAEFLNITKEDITAKGKLRPIGARHFASRAQLVQNMLGVFNSPIGSLIAPHVSSKKLAAMVEDLFGLDRYDLIKENVALVEQAETARLSQQLSEEVNLEAETDLEQTEPIVQEEVIEDVEGQV